MGTRSPTTTSTPTTTTTSTKSPTTTSRLSTTHTNCSNFQGAFLPPWNDDPARITNWNDWCAVEVSEGCEACGNSDGAARYCQRSCSELNCPGIACSGSRRLLVVTSQMLQRKN